LAVLRWPLLFASAFHGETIMPTPTSGRAKRGFAAMSPEKQREIAAKGGRASHGGGRRPGSLSSRSRTTG
jgi:general stress protein YciG